MTSFRKKGFYLLKGNTRPFHSFREFMLITGVRKNNKYKIIWSDSFDKEWRTMNWNGVPKQEDLDKYYIRHDSPPDDWWDRDWIPFKQDTVEETVTRLRKEHPNKSDWLFLDLD